MSQQHSMRTRRPVGAEPYAPKTLKAITGGAKGTTPVTTACMSRSWEVEAKCTEKKKLTIRYHQSASVSAARSTSSAEQHKLICSYVPTRALALGPANDHSNGVRDHSNNKARHPHTAPIYMYVSPNSFVGGKEHQTMRYRDECMPPLVYSVDTVYLLRAVQLNDRKRNL